MMGVQPGTVAACAKHFAGDGATAFGTGTIGDKRLDRGDVRMDEEGFRRRHVSPYEAAGGWWPLS